MWGAIGSYIFGITDGPNSESLKIGVNYAEHNRIGRNIRACKQYEMTDGKNETN